MRHGGSYRKDKGGKPKLISRTKDHPDGHAPRGADGKRLDRPEPKPEKAAAETGTKSGVGLAGRTNPKPPAKAARKKPKE